jgi:hypothetical protein
MRTTLKLDEDVAAQLVAGRSMVPNEPPARSAILLERTRATA